MKISQNQLITKILTSLIIIIISILIYTQVNLDGYKNQFILPLLYLIFFEWLLWIVKIKYNKLDNKSILIKALNIICYIKYVISPLSYLYIIRYGGWGGDNKLGFGPEPSISNLNCAIILQSLEIIVISLVLIFYMKFNTKEKSISKEYFLENKSVVICFFVIAAPIAILLNNNGDLGIINVISKFFYLVMLIFWIKICYKINISISIRIILSLIGLFLYMLFSMNTLSRWNIVFITIAYLITLKRLYGSIPKKIIISIFLVLIIVFINISFLKFAWLFETSGNSLISLIGYYISQIPDYFSGIRPLAQSLNLGNIYDITHITFLNDFFGNIPGFGYLVDNMNRMNIYFNLYNWGYYREVLIIPLLGEGFAFLGYLAPVYSLICLLLVLYAEKMIYKTRNIENAFIFTYAGLYSCMFPGFDLQIIMVHLFTITLPALLLFSLNSKVLIKINLFNR